MTPYRKDAPKAIQTDDMGNTMQVPSWDLATLEDVQELIKDLAKDVKLPFLPFNQGGVNVLGDNPSGFGLYWVAPDYSRWPYDKPGEMAYVAGELLSLKNMYDGGKGKWVLGDPGYPMPNWRLYYQWDVVNEIAGWNAAIPGESD